MAKNDGTTRITECPKCGYRLKVMKFANETKRKITCPDCGWRKPAATKTTKTAPKPAVQMAIAILFYDTRLEGVEAIVAIPAGQTADQTFEAYLIHAAKEQEVADEDLAQWREGYGYDELPIEILPPTILGLPIEKRETIADLLDDSDCI